VNKTHTGWRVEIHIRLWLSRLLPERILNLQSLNLLKLIFGSSKRNARLTGIVERMP